MHWPPLIANRGSKPMKMFASTAHSASLAFDHGTSGMTFAALAFGHLERSIYRPPTVDGVFHVKKRRPVLPHSELPCGS